MKFTRILLSTGVFAAALAQAPKPAPKRKPQIREVKATGCIQKLRNGCLLLKTLDGQTTYSFQASPQPDAGSVVTIQGTPHDGPGPCNQGLALDVTDWQPTGEQCVE
ncbi:MAG: hypothetical protein LAP38_14090 [Acidobacteriia bacterium]|nr:hypothetical protein [Terriglobia bacterium]